MSLRTRISRLEKLAKTKSGPEYGLYDVHGEAVEAELLREPTPEAEGLARLADGTEKAVILESGPMAFIFERTDKLWWIRRDGPIFSFAGSGLTEDDI